MLLLDHEKKVPLYEQLYREIRNKILSGEYKKDDHLKPIRILAKELQVSHNTVNSAYQQLLAEGYIRSVQGSGFYVEALFGLAKDKTKVKKETDHSKGSEKYNIRYDFDRHKYANDKFPWGRWANYVQKAILDSIYKDYVEEGENKGDYELRKVICEYIHESRGVNCVPEQVVICASTENAVELVTSLLPQTIKTVGMEEPGSDKMRGIFLHKGYEIEPIPVKGQGIDVNYVEQLENCDLLYITPSFQFPTGVTLPLTKRIQLLQWLRRKNIYCIENDYDNEFLLGNEPILSLQSLDTTGKVIYIDTFANTLSTEIKCAFVVLTEELAKAYDEKYRFFRATVSNYEQCALMRYISDGNLERQARRIAISNRKKKDYFSNYVKANMIDIMELISSEAGSHYLLKIYGCRSESDFLERLMRQGVKIYSAREYWHEKINAPKNIFMISFNNIREDEMEEACDFFEKAIREVLG